MKKLFLPLIILLSFTLPNLSGKVVGIADGDTITILTADNIQVKIRLNGIDCPEKSQAFGNKAKQFTSELCFGKEISIVDHGKDRYGRTIGDVILPGGISVNQELVKNGFAWHYKKYSKDTTLSRLETEARTKKLGLWKDPNPIAPWDFRKMN